eukprot:gene34411-41650_t
MRSLKFAFCFLALLSITILRLVSSEFVVVTVNPLFFNYVGVAWDANGDVYAIGNQVSGGVVVKSTDYGMTWTQIGTTSNFPSALYGIAARRLSNGDFLITVDDAGGIFTYSGTSWTQQDSIPGVLVGATIGLNGNAFVCGSVSYIYKSTNSSSYATWVDITPAANS